MNAYVTAPITEKIWTVLGPEFGADAGKKAIIVRALYGLKISGAVFCNHFTDFMRHIGYKYCTAYPYICLKPKVRPSNGFEY